MVLPRLSRAEDEERDAIVSFPDVTYVELDGLTATEAAAEQEREKCPVANPFFCRWVWSIENPLNRIERYELCRPFLNPLSQRDDIADDPYRVADPGSDVDEMAKKSPKDCDSLRNCGVGDALPVPSFALA